MTLEDAKQLNCAQQVCASIYSNLIDKMKNLGGGKAPGHVCGALYAVYLKYPKMRDRLEKQFAARVGGVECDEIKKSRFPCSECVRIAIYLAESAESKK